MKYFLAFFLLLCYFIGDCQSTQFPVDFHNCGFTAIAHRGYSEFYPENTLIAIEEAFRRGVKYCEVDVALSSDGIYILHHDPYTIERTTSGKGKILDLSWAELSQLDAGGWKESHFSNVKVPRLIDALKLAQKYDAFLYLDIKEFNPEGLSLALKQSGADPSRMLPAITSLESATEFRQYSPDSPWVWFGADPADPNDKGWFEQRVALGCRVFELTENKVLYEREWTLQFIEQAHSVGAKVWAYTINNESRIKEFADLGIDGVETDRPYAAQLKVCGYNPVSNYPEKITTGNWNFKAGNLESTGVGSRLKYLAQVDSIVQPVVFGSTKQFGISSIGGTDTIVAKIPAYNPSNGLFAYDNFMMEDSGAIDYTYSIVMDIYVPSANKGKFISLIQTNPDNLNDADFFINPQGQLGTSDNYHGEFKFDTWKRLVFVLDDNIIRKYIDGNFVGATEVKGSRWTVFNNMAYHGKHGLLFFADDDLETAEVYASALQLRSYALSPDEISALGGVKASGIPLNNKKVFSSGVDNLESELVDWEQQTIFITQAGGSASSEIPYQLMLSYGATTSIPESGTFDFSNGEQTFQVIAADGSSTDWTIHRLLIVGIDDWSNKPEVLVYPNPFRYHLIVKLETAARLELVNTMGQVLYRKDLVAGENVLNIIDLPSATYLYRIQNNEGYSTNGILLKSN